MIVLALQNKSLVLSLLPKTNVYVKSYDGEAKWMKDEFFDDKFLDDELLKK